MDWGESRAAGPWLKLRLDDPDKLEPFRGLDTATAKHTGHILHVTIAQGDIAELAEESPDPAAPYGDAAAALRRSGFFRAPAVWRAVGKDDEFLAWLRLQRCANPACKDPWRDVEAAHVRRVADGAGTNLKPVYSAISLCKPCHALQHSQGEGAIAGGREWFDRQRIEHLESWCWEKLKTVLGHKHWNEVPPVALYRWAERHAVTQYLPSQYRYARPDGNSHPVPNER